MKFVHPGDSHSHSVETLNQLYEYDDFMASIKTVLDLGCGSGDDLVWWATRTTRDEIATPLNIQCTGVDLAPELKITKQHNNVFYQQVDFEGAISTVPDGFDVLWCHDAFQYAHSPVKTLSQWWDLTSTGGMLYIAVPQTIDFYRRQFDYHLPSGCYYHYTMVNLMYMLATAGWDCRAGFFKQPHYEPWIHAVVYKSEHKPLDPKTTTWHKLVESNLLPDSAVRSIDAHNYLRQQDLIVPWIDHSLMSMAIR
jgi:SAM-dependent methyltransferase